jgi:hypothetical protein
MINFNTDKLILGLYPMGAGGKFLTNCLSISEDVLIGDRGFSELQLSGKLEPKDKFNLLRNTIRKTSDDQWEDFYLDEISFWEVYPEDLDHKSVEEHISELNQNYFLEKVTRSNDKYFFLLPHYRSSYVKLKKLWKNSKSIVFKNSSLFVLLRNCHREFSMYLWVIMREHHLEHMNLMTPYWRSLPIHILEELKTIDIDKMRSEYKKFTFESIWSNLRKNNWPENPPITIKEYIGYDINLRKEVENAFNNYSGCYFSELENYPDELINDSDYVWDTNWFFDKELTLYKIGELYKSLNISDYNEDRVSTLYGDWIEKNNSITLNSRL